MPECWNRASRLTIGKWRQTHYWIPAYYRGNDTSASSHRTARSGRMCARVLQSGIQVDDWQVASDTLLDSRLLPRE
jgi:hypothetical protein